MDDRPRAPRAVRADEGRDHGGRTGDADRVSTLARADRTPIPNTLSDRTVAALRAVEAAGRDVVFVTGRPPRWMGEIAEQTGHTGMAVCGNGALIYDLHTETVAQRFELPAEIGRQAAEAIRAAMPEAAFAVEAANGFGREPGYALRRDRPEARVAALGQLLDGPVVKLLVRHETAAVDELPATARGCSAIWSR